MWLCFTGSCFLDIFMYHKIVSCVFLKVDMCSTLILIIPFLCFVECDPKYCKHGGVCDIEDGQVKCNCTGTNGFTGEVCDSKYIIELNAYIRSN